MSEAWLPANPFNSSRRCLQCCSLSGLDGPVRPGPTQLCLSGLRTQSPREHGATLGVGACGNYPSVSAPAPTYPARKWLSLTGSSKQADAAATLRQLKGLTRPRTPHGAGAPRGVAFLRGKMRFRGHFGISDQQLWCVQQPRKSRSCQGPHLVRPAPAHATSTHNIVWITAPSLTTTASIFQSIR